MPIGPPTPPGPPGAPPAGPAVPAPPILPPILPPVPPAGGGVGGAALQRRGPIITRFDYSPTGTVSGGSWVNRPATMLDPKPQATAVATAGSVAFSVTLAANAAIGLIYFQNLIADVSATVSVTAGPFSQTKAVYPSDFSGPYDQFEFERLGRPRFFVLPVPVVTNRVDVSISGSIIPIQLGYIGICSIWQSPIGQKYGWDITIKDLSTLDRVTYGTPYPTHKQGLRVLHLGFDFLIQGGVYANVADQVFAGTTSPFQAALLAGKANPIAGVPFPDDPDNIERQSVGGFINTDQQFTNPLFATWDSTFSIEQM